MAIGLRGTTTSALTATTINTPALTLANDVVVIVAGSQNANWSNGSSTLPNNTAVTWSGLGATWISFAYNNGGTQNGYAVWIGHSCAPGLAAITRSGTPPTTVNGLYAIAQFSGASTNPLVSYTPILSNASTQSYVSATVAYRQGQLLLATCESYTWTSQSGNWGGIGDSLAVAGGTLRIPLIDYLVALNTPTGGTATWNSPTSASGQIFNAGQAFVINPANDNFMSFM
jgi:hypothetical protein